MLQIIKKIKLLFKTVNDINELSNKQKKDIVDLKMLIAKKLIKEPVKVTKLIDAEFKVFSQWGDDGIIQYLINNIDIKNKIFIEFGVENYTEANTRFLLINNNWKGLIFDGSEKNIEYVKNDEIYWKYDITAKAKFITVENINELIANENIKGNIGILHIDIDGNDYWVWKNITVVDADIVIVEYNSVFGNKRPITIPYNPEFIRSHEHYSNLYYGTSILSICDLAEEKGYCFVGCNSAGNNAYFVKNEKIGNIKPTTIQEGFVDAKFRESRDLSGKLSFLSGEAKQKLICGLKVYNTRTNNIEVL